MKTFIQMLWLAIIVTMISCGDQKGKGFPKSSFDSPFPKRNLDLTKILGEQLSVKTATDTLHLKISCSKNFNLITYNKRKDTLFFWRRL